VQNIFQQYDGDVPQFGGKMSWMMRSICHHCHRLSSSSLLPSISSQPPLLYYN